MNSLDHNFFENDSEEQLEEDMLDEENEEDDNADDTGDYMPPLLQGHRVTLEGKFILFKCQKQVISTEWNVEYIISTLWWHNILRWQLFDD